MNFKELKEKEPTEDGLICVADRCVEPSEKNFDIVGERCTECNLGLVQSDITKSNLERINHILKSHGMSPITEE